MTVGGPVPADRLGFTLIHEHLLLDLMRDAWIGNHILNDPDLAALELQRYKDAGGVTLVDQTNRGLAQDPLAVKRHRRTDRESRSFSAAAGTARRTTRPYLIRWKTDQIADQMVADITRGHRRHRRSGRASSARSARTPHGSRPPKSACCGRPAAPTPDRAHDHPARHARPRSAWTSSTSWPKKGWTRAASSLAMRRVIRCSSITPRSRGGAHSSPFDRMGATNPVRPAEEPAPGPRGRRGRARAAPGAVARRVLSLRSGNVRWLGLHLSFQPACRRPRQIGVSDAELQAIMIDNPRRALTGAD